MEKYIPIFPLNTVLFPGVNLEIQIFEERYKKLIEHVLHTNNQLGIFCIKEGLEAYGPLPTPYEIGTLSQVYQHDPMEDLYRDNTIFRVNVVGIKKIKILHYYESSEHYLVGNIISQEENIISKDINDEIKNDFFKQVQEYLKYQNFENLDFLNVNNFILLCHYIIKHMNIPLSEKQKLLELSTFDERWKKTYQILKEKNSIIHQLKNIKSQDDEEDFLN